MGGQDRVLPENRDANSFSGPADIDNGGGNVFSGGDMLSFNPGN